MGDMPSLADQFEDLLHVVWECERRERSRAAWTFAAPSRSKTTTPPHICHLTADLTASSIIRWKCPCGMVWVRIFIGAAWVPVGRQERDTLNDQKS